MGTPIRFEGELALTRDEGFPAEAAVGAEHAFAVPGRIVFNLVPNRVHLVEVEGERRRRVGHAMILSLTIDPVAEATSGRFRVHMLYPAGYAALADVHEATDGD